MGGSRQEEEEERGRVQIARQDPLQLLKCINHNHGDDQDGVGGCIDGDDHNGNVKQQIQHPKYQIHPNTKYVRTS